MIGRLQGVLIQKNPPTVCIDVHGVGYDCDVPMSTFYHLPEVDQPVVLYTHLQVREDAHLLYGFLTLAERETFRTLVKVSGIGARTALSILSGLSVDEIQQSVSLGDVVRLTKIPGIGKKTAERLLLELRGKFNVSVTPTATGEQVDIINALLALGYSDKEVRQVVSKLDPAISLEDGIRQSLQLLSK